MKWWGAIGLLLVASALVWQRDRDKVAAAAQAQKERGVSLAMAPRILPHPDKELEVFDVVMRLTTDISRRADQRPIYMVSGRIKNHTMYEVDEVWIGLRVRNVTTEETMDSTVVKLEDLGLPGNDGVVSFSRTVQVLPPPKWGFTYDVIQAKSEPAFSDADFDVGIQSSK